MSWGPTLRAELAELFLEEWTKGRSRKWPTRRDLEHLGLRVGQPPVERGGLCQAQLELLEALTVERRYQRALARRGLSDPKRKMLLTLERVGLVRAWRQPFRGRQEAWFAEITQRGWRVLLGKEKARRV